MGEGQRFEIAATDHASLLITVQLPRERSVPWTPSYAWTSALRTVWTREPQLIGRSSEPERVMCFLRAKPRRRKSCRKASTSSSSDRGRAVECSHQGLHVIIRTSKCCSSRRAATRAPTRITRFLAFMRSRARIPSCVGTISSSISQIPTLPRETPNARIEAYFIRARAQLGAVLRTMQ